MAKTVDNSKAQPVTALNPDGKLDLTGLTSKDFPLTYKLRSPIVDDDTSTKSITIKAEPTADLAFFMADSDQPGGSAMALAMERWLCVDEKVIRGMSLKDYGPIASYLNSFL